MGMHWPDQWACIQIQGKINGHALARSMGIHPDPRQNQWACTGQINGHASRSKAKSMGMHPDPRQNQWACTGQACMRPGPRQNQSTPAQHKVRSVLLYLHTRARVHSGGQKLGHGHML